MTTEPCTAKTTTPPFASHASGHPTTTQVKRKNSKVNAISYFLCFRSVDVIVSGKRGRHPEYVIPYVAMGEKEGVFPKVVPLALSLPTSDNEGGDKEKFRPIDQQAKKVKCGFSQVLNAVGLKTALATKVQKRKPSKSFACTTNESSFTSSYDRNWSQEDVPRISETFAVQEKEGEVLPKVSPTASRVLGHEEEDKDRHYWRNKGRCKLCRIFNAIMFETYLAKKLRKSTKGKTFGRNESSFFEEDDLRMASDSTASSVTNVSVFTTSSLNSSGSLSRTSSSTTRSLSKRLKSFRSKSTRSFKNNLRYLSDIFRSNSNRSSRPNLRSSSSKNKWFELNLSNGLKEEQGQDQSDVMSIKKKKNKKKANTGYYRSIVSLCFLFMGLLGLIFYGKICGILCTSMWLFSAPLWTSVGDHYGSARKKKPVTRGLLVRDNITTIHSR